MSYMALQGHTLTQTYALSQRLAGVSHDCVNGSWVTTCGILTHQTLLIKPLLVFQDYQ